MRKFPVLLATSLTLVAPAALAAVSDEDFEQLRQQLAAVSERLEELAAENTQLRQSQSETRTSIATVQSELAETTVASDSWSDRISLDGDFRYRFEKIDEQDTPSRRRNRIRARANIRADLTDDVEVGFGIATGGDDPVSANQTLGSGGSSKDNVLNLAYADWEATEDLHIIAGKFKNPLTRVGGQPLMFDGDWTPEGLGLTWKRDWFFANAMGTWLESDSKKSNTNHSWGTQFGASGQIGGAKLRGGLGYYSIKTKGEPTTFGDPSDPADFYGNTAVEPSGVPCGTNPGTGCVYLYDYLLTQAFAEASFEVGGWPAIVFADYIRNSDASDNNIGWTLGTKIGQTSDRGQVQFAYYYADKPADAIFGLLSDSDFAGGGVDNRGHWFQLMFGVNKTWSIGAQYFINEVDIASGNKTDYNRVMIDTQWKWQ